MQWSKAESFSIFENLTFAIDLVNFLALKLIAPCDSCWVNYKSWHRLMFAINLVNFITLKLIAPDWFKIQCQIEIIFHLSEGESTFFIVLDFLNKVLVSTMCNVRIFPTWVFLVKPYPINLSSNGGAVSKDM